MSYNIEPSFNVITGEIKKSNEIHNDVYKDNELCVLRNELIKSLKDDYNKLKEVDKKVNKKDTKVGLYIDFKNNQLKYRLYCNDQKSYFHIDITEFNVWKSGFDSNFEIHFDYNNFMKTLDFFTKRDELVLKFNGRSTLPMICRDMDREVLLMPIRK